MKDERPMIQVTNEIYIWMKLYNNVTRILMDMLYSENIIGW